MDNIRYSITITGTVQGVGFRPMVFKLAQQYCLIGFVKNNNDGVKIEIQGTLENAHALIKHLKNHPPQMAKIRTFNVIKINLKEPSEINFTILASSDKDLNHSDISPDLATCNECLKELFDKKNRRYLYPFINCIHCGPRFSIIHKRPYDRERTSMKAFKMCQQCQEEYDNPSNRRFHAQPNACPQCGPQLSLFKSKTSNLAEAIHLLKIGKILAIKSLGGFNICCDSTHKETISRLRIQKHRPYKSFAIMGRNIAVIQNICHVSACEKNILKSAAAPIVLLRKKNSNFDHLSPENNYLAIMLPSTPLHHLIMLHFEFLIMTSANKINEPIAIKNKEMTALLDQQIIDEAIVHNRDIIHRVDDSILQIINDTPQMIRRSRGYCPSPLPLTQHTSTVCLALGSSQKNTFSLRSKNMIFPSQHIGEITDHRNYLFGQNEIINFCQLLEVTPQAIIQDSNNKTDKHPLKQSMLYHHHAHMLSVLAEHNLSGKKTLGLICDGTGVGNNNTIWGFEFLYCHDDIRQFSRWANLTPFPLPGGELAITQIDRIAIGLKQTHQMPIESNARNKQLIKMLEHKINSPMTSSLGRLFDGVAALLNVTQQVAYEAQAAIKLQTLAEDFHGTTVSYTVSIQHRSDGSIQINHDKLILEILQDINQQLQLSEMAYKFHLWVVKSIMQVLDKLSFETLVISGGCFQNKLLTMMLLEQLKLKNITSYRNNYIPTNDGGISIGQALAGYNNKD